MTQLTGRAFLCLGLFLAAAKAKVNSLDHGHVSVVPEPSHSSSDKGRVDAKQSHQSWIDRFDAALRSLIIPETIKIISASDVKGAGHETEAGDLEGSRLKRESVNDAKMKGVSENDEKRSAGDQKKTEVKEMTKEKTKEINDKVDKSKDVREEKKIQEKSKMVGKRQLEKTKTRQNLYAEEDADEFDTGLLRRSKFSDFKTDSKPYRSAKIKRYLEITNDDSGNFEDEKEEELENLMRHRKFKSRLARNYDDRRSRRNMNQHEEHRRRRHHNGGDGGKLPRRSRKKAGDKSYRHRRYYDDSNPFALPGDDSPMRRAYRYDARGNDLRQRGRRHGGHKSKFQNRRSDEDVESTNENDDAVLRLDDKEYEALLRSSRNAENEDVGNVRNTRDLNDHDYERQLRFDNEDKDSDDDEQGRSVRLSSGSSEEEDIRRNDDERMKKRLAADDETVEERRRRSQGGDEDDDDDEDAYLKSHFMRRSAVDGNTEWRDVDRRRHVEKNVDFYEQDLPRGTIIRRGKRRPVWKSIKRRPIIVDY